MLLLEVRGSRGKIRKFHEDWILAALRHTSMCEQLAQSLFDELKTLDLSQMFYSCHTTIH